jgi:DNA replication protein DnaC
MWSSFRRKVKKSADFFYLTGTAILADEERRGLFEIMEDRYERRSARIAAQFPIDNWHQATGDPAPAGAIRDRRIHNAHRIALKSGT